MQLLTAKPNCLQKYPVFAFGDYAYYDPSNASVEVLDTQTPTPQPAQVLLDNHEITLLDFNYGTVAPPSDAYFLGVKNTTTCRAKFLRRTRSLLHASPLRPGGCASGSRLSGRGPAPASPRLGDDPAGALGMQELPH